MNSPTLLTKYRGLQMIAQVVGIGCRAHLLANTMSIMSVTLRLAQICYLHNKQFVRLV